MLSISKPIRRAGQGEYYLSLAATDDYYLENEGEPPGYWLGEGASALGLSGLLEKAHFRNLLRGLSPDGKTKLVHNANSEGRRAGWDLTWSVPKSVSVAWSQAAPDTRKEIEECVRRAVKIGTDYLQGVGVISRRGEDGILREEAKLVFAAFEHSTSRAQDPQLHIHTILLNIGVRHDGTTGALEPKNIFRHQMAAGALFRAELAAELEDCLGLRTRREGRAFELIGVSPELITFFSKRRSEIEALLRERGHSGGKAAEVAALESRTTKKSISRAKLFANWHTAGQEHHWTGKDLAWLLRAPFPPRDPEREIQLAANTALTQLTSQQSTFSYRQLLQAVAEECQGRALNARKAFAITDGLFRSPELVRLCEHKGELHWTTREVLALERSILKAVETMRAKETLIPESSRQVEEGLKQHSHLSLEQKEALMHVCEAKGAFRLVQGMAGTGKSTLFAAAREVWVAQGLEVFGAAPSGKAAQGFQESTGIRSATLHRTLNQIHRGELVLNSESVLVVDEAAMVGTRELAKLFAVVVAGGGGVVLCGDTKQLQPVELGGVFAELARRFPSSELTEIRRQREAWAREAVKDFANGRAECALPAYEKRGLVQEDIDTLAAIDRLIADWKNEALLDPRGTVILAATIQEVSTLNRRAQEERLRAGFLQGQGTPVGAEIIFISDRVLFTRNSMSLGVFNGDTGTVRDVKPTSLRVELDDKRFVQVDPRTYHHVQLGYALTTHKAQGMTVERSYILTGGSMTGRELSYVQASRARGATRWYVNDDLDEVTFRMKRSRAKEAALSLTQTCELTLALNS